MNNRHRLSKMSQRISKSSRESNLGVRGVVGNEYDSGHQPVFPDICLNTGRMMTDGCNQIMFAFF